MADRMTRLAKKGDWKKYKEAAKKEWRAYLKKECESQAGDDGSIDLNQDAWLMLANRLPIELLIEPALWHAAQEKAENEYELKATIRGLLKMWVDGTVDPWE